MAAWQGTWQAYALNKCHLLLPLVTVLTEDSRGQEKAGSWWLLCPEAAGIGVGPGGSPFLGAVSLSLQRALCAVAQAGEASRPRQRKASAPLPQLPAQDPPKGRGGQLR